MDGVNKYDMVEDYEHIFDIFLKRYHQRIKSAQDLWESSESQNKRGLGKRKWTLVSTSGILCPEPSKRTLCFG